MTVHLLCIARGATALIVLVTLLPFMPGSHPPVSVRRYRRWPGCSASPASCSCRSGALDGVGLLASFFRTRVRACGRGPDRPVIVSGILSMAAFALRRPVARRRHAGVRGIHRVQLETAIATIRFAGPLGAGHRLSPPYRASRRVSAAAVTSTAGSGIQPRWREFGNAASLIADIERHRAARGTYPASLLSVWKDYSPAVIGIEKYHYERSGEHTNLLFEQPRGSRDAGRSSSTTRATSRSPPAATRWISSNILTRAPGARARLLCGVIRRRTRTGRYFR